MHSKAINVAIFIHNVREQNMRLKKNAEKNPKHSKFKKTLTVTCAQYMFIK